MRIGSDDESGLTKALDSVFPEATRLLCTKHMKDNVSEYLKNSLSSTDKQRSDIISKLFGSNGLVAAEDCFEFESKSENLISENPEFARYFDSRLKNRLLEHVNKPQKQLQHELLWTNNNCKSINHVAVNAIATPTQLFEALLKPTQNYSPQMQEERLLITSSAVAYSCQATDYPPDIYRCPFCIFNLFLKKSLKLDCFLLYIYFF